MQIASLTKGNLFREFHEIIIKIEKLYFEIQKDAERLGYQGFYVIMIHMHQTI